MIRSTNRTISVIPRVEGVGGVFKGPSDDLKYLEFFNNNMPFAERKDNITFV